MHQTPDPTFFKPRRARCQSRWIIGVLLLTVVACSPPSDRAVGEAAGLTSEEEAARYGERTEEVQEEEVLEAVESAPAAILEVSGRPAETEGPFEQPEELETTVDAGVSEQSLPHPEAELPEPALTLEAAAEVELDSPQDPSDDAEEESGIEPRQSLMPDDGSTPAPTMTFNATGFKAGGHPADAQVAVSRTHVCVVGRSAIACYTKGGRQVFPAAGVNTGNVFFNSVRGGMNVFDMRAIFDHFRNRFWIVGLANGPDPRLLVAVSKSQDPRQGFYRYWFRGTDSRAPSAAAGDTIDYPRIGIDDTAFYETHVVNGGGGYKYTLVSLRKAAQMTAGEPGNTIQGWLFWDLENPNGTRASHLAPAVHHSHTNRGYLVSRYGDDQLLVWAVNNPLTPAQSVSRRAVDVRSWRNLSGVTHAQLPGLRSTPRVKFDNLRNWPLNAQYRSGQLVVTANDRGQWQPGQFDPAVRAIHLDITNFGSGADPTIRMDRRFGAPDFGYGWASIGLNKNQDLAMLFMRTRSTLYPQVRVTARYSSDSDLRPSRLVRAGVDTFVPGCCGNRVWYDTAGVSTDPYDDVALYFAQQYPAGSGNNNFNIVVAKMFGGRHLDILPYNVLIQQTSVSPGGSLLASLVARNDGDASLRSATSGSWYLSTNDFISAGDRQLATFSLPGLSSTDSESVNQTLTIPKRISAGTYWIGVCLDTSGTVAEYSESNNCNRAYNHSRAVQITVN